MDGYRETLMGLYEAVLRQQSELGGSIRMLFTGFAVLFTAAGLVFEREYYSYFPALVGVGSLLLMWYVNVHFSLMGKIYESNIIRFEIEYILENGERSGDYPGGGLAVLFSRGRLSDDGLVLALALGFLFAGGFASSCFSAMKWGMSWMNGFILLQLGVLILVLAVLFLVYGRDQTGYYNQYRAKYKLSDPDVKNALVVEKE